MSRTKAAGPKNGSGTPGAETSSPEKPGISESLQKLQQAGAKLYTEMSGLAVSGEALATLRDMVREIGETRLESEVMEHEYQASLGTLHALEGVRGKQGGVLSPDEIARLNSLPDALGKAVEEQEAFAREMDRLQAEFESLAARLEQTEAALLEAQKLKEDAQQRRNEKNGPA